MWRCGDVVMWQRKDKNSGLSPRNMTATLELKSSTIRSGTGARGATLFEAVHGARGELK